jgi:hypothetical protein
MSAKEILEIDDLYGLAVLKDSKIVASNPPRNGRSERI